MRCPRARRPDLDVVDARLGRCDGLFCEHDGLELDRLVAETRRVHEERLQRLLEQHDVRAIRSKQHLIKGDPGEVIEPALRIREGLGDDRRDVADVLPRGHLGEI